MTRIVLRPAARAWVPRHAGESGAERVLSLRGAGVEALVLAGEVESPVFLEVSVADHRADGENCLGAVQAPSRPSQVEAVGYEMPACSLDYARRDRPAGLQGLVVARR
jgi:hypothetical protein